MSAFTVWTHRVYEGYWSPIARVFRDVDDGYLITEQGFAPVGFFDQKTGHIGVFWRHPGNTIYEMGRRAA